jgi:glyoxylase-like metal-dependent hydrolase (beta-lactamase superfamily II)
MNHAATNQDQRVVATELPQPGTVVEIVPGIGWMRLPLPFHLNHVNIWLLDDGDGWTAIDCGANTADTRELWNAVLAGPQSAKPVHRIVATHGHVDHVGFVGPLHRHLGRPPFFMTRVEWLSASLRAAQSSSVEENDAAKRFFAMHGFPDEDIDAVSRRPAALDLLSSLPPYVRLVDNATIRMGERDWTLIVRGGHAPEHASFYCPEERILIAGDQILSPITPVIGVYPPEPEADPLGDYLKSLPTFAALAADTLVLPSHGVPFHGLTERAEALRRHHEERLTAVCEASEASATAFDVANVCFPQAMKDNRKRLAFAETLAHLNHAVAVGRLHKWFEHDRIRFLIR